MASSHDAAMIQSITIPDYAIALDKVVRYNIHVASPTSKQVIPHRYSDFVQLESSLRRELGTAVPGALPPKRTASWLFGRKELSTVEMGERRNGLERWLKGIIAHKDYRWAQSRSIKAFLTPDKDSKEVPQVEFVSSANWLANHTALLAHVRTTHALFAKRDAMKSNQDSNYHQINSEGRKSLVDLLLQLQKLTLGLKELAGGGMVEGELRRREGLVLALQDEVENLGRLANATAPASSAHRATASSSARLPRGQQEAPTADRNALLASSKPAGRVLGASASSNKETSITRALDNSGLLQLQQTYATEQDTKLDALTVSLRRQRELGELISRELSEQGELLDGLDADVDRVGGKLKNTQKTLKKLK